MKAIRFHRTGGPEVLQMEDLPKPRAGAGEVLVRIEAAGVNYADTVRRRGIYYPRPTPLPHIAGAEFVGMVEATGPDVDAGLVGTRVIGAGDGGGYAEYIAVPAPAVFPFPRGIEPAQGTALYIQGLTAALILKKSVGLKEGDSVFVEAAAGGVGSLAVQLAKLYGAGLVIGGASTEDKRAMARRLGADAAVDYTQKGWSKKLREITGGRGVDIVMEMTAGATFAECFDCLAPLGRVVIFGSASGESFAPIPPGQLFRGSFGVSGFYLGTLLPMRDLITDTLAELRDFVLSGRLKIEMGGIYPLEQAREAHQALESRKTTGKLVLLP